MTCLSPAELEARLRNRKTDSEDVIRLESKKDIAKRLDGLSPDIADALAITFAVDTSFYTGLVHDTSNFGHNGGPPLDDWNPYEGFRSAM